MIATAKIDVYVEVEKTDAARIYNQVVGWKADTESEHEVNGEALRTELQTLVNHAVSMALVSYRMAENKKS